VVRAAGVVTDSGQDFHLPLHEEPRVGGEEPRHPDRGRVGTVGRGERVVHEGVERSGQLPRERGVVLLLFGVEPHVLQHHHPPRREALHRPGDLVPHTLRQGANVRPEELPEALGHRRHPQLLDHPPVRPPEVRQDGDPRPPLLQPPHRGEHGPDAAVLRHPAGGEGDVEVGPEEDLQAPRRKITNRTQFHRNHRPHSRFRAREGQGSGV